MTKIIHWGKYCPPFKGGMESATYIAALGAAATGHDTTLLCFGKRSSPKPSTNQGIRIITAPISATLLSQPLSWEYLWWAIREGNQSEIVHLHAPNMLAALASIFLNERAKLIVHWHSDVVNKGVLGQALQPLERSMLKRADLVICTSKAYIEGSRTLKPFINKIKVVPIGVADPSSENVSCYIPEMISTLIAGRKIILSVGRLIPYKGFNILIDAATQLPDDSVVVIVGSGPQEKNLIDQVNKLNLNSKVILTGKLDDLSLKSLYRQATLFCLPSTMRSEAFGVVLVEAMAYGLPIVATRIPGSGVSWVNQHGVSGLNVEAGNPDELAEACIQILSSSKLQDTFAHGARKRYMEEFAENVFINRLLNIYLEVLN